jgi:hypothetical protein
LPAPPISAEERARRIAAHAAHPSNHAAAAASIGLAPSTFKCWLEKHEANGGMVVTGRSTLRNAEGEVVMEWEKTSLDRQKAQEAQEAAYAALAAKLPRIAPVAAPRASEGHLHNVYTLTDAHIGMLAWHREGGEDWDLEIAERTIVGCFEQAIRSAPNAELAILNQLGDLLHYDSLQSVTPTSGHLLDADGRFTKMVEVAVRVIRRVVAMLLAKHPRVHMILAEGNHDIASSVWLRTMFKALYENEPRITVDDSALPYYAIQCGDVAQFFHHSHLKKMEHLPGLFAAQFPKIWGATKYRYIHTGDKHHAYEKDDRGAHVIQHPTLAARDAYSARGGWHSMRGMNAITFHNGFGQVGRVTITPEMLAA